MTARTLGIITLPGTVERVAEARRYVGDLLHRSGHHLAADDAELLTSECVTNAVQHTLSGAGGQFAVKVLDLGDAVRIEVLDQGGARTIPAVRGTPDSPTAIDGRGLHLVTMLAADWGTMPYGPGTITWFMVTTEAAPPAARDTDV
jgi:anti-sigma regulatory factor (Ser/Thr protein kinase)